MITTDNSAALANALKEIERLQSFIAAEKPDPVGHLYTIAGVQHCTITQKRPDCALYTHPAAREPLTPAQRVDICDACADLDLDDNWLGDVGKIIDLVEAAHGIGAKP